MPRYVLGELKQVDPGLMAAAVAYNAFFALVPAAIAVLAIAGLIGRSGDVLETVRATLGDFVPDEIGDYLLDVIEDADVATTSEGVLVIVVSVAIALYAGSRGVVAMQRALRMIEEIDEHRSTAVVRLIGIGLTIGAGVALLLVTLGLLIGRRVVEFFVDLTGIDAIETLWTWVSTPLAVVGLFVFMWALYHWGPPRPLPATGVAALAATVAATLVSSGFGWYLSNFSLGSTYGLLGTFAVALLWLYLLAYAVLYSAGLVVYGWSRGRQELAALQAAAAADSADQPSAP